jgi:16S rRNA (cytidine1402-2'-O)-methyltransferase
MSGTLFVVATPIGNLEDITARALRILGEVSLIAAEDTRRTHHLLSRYAIATPTTSLHEHNEGRKLSAIVERLRSGEHVALVSDAGTPTISDPGQRLIRAAIDAGLRVEPIPGPSATISALAASGMAWESFTFLGFPPVRSKDRTKWLQDLADAGRPVVFFEAPHRIRRTLAEILELMGDRPVTIAREVTKIHEEFLRGTISEVLGRLLEPVGEFTIVIDVGHKTINDQYDVPSASEIASEFGRMTDNNAISKRIAIGKIAKEYGLSTNAVYTAVEQAKKLVE